LLQAWIYLWLGHIQEQVSKIIYPFFLFHLSAVLYWGLCKARFQKSTALCLAVLFSLSPIVIQVSQQNYADLPLSFFISTSVIVLYVWFREPKDEYLLYAQILLGLGGWVKNEGLIVWGIVNLVFLLFSFFSRSRVGYATYLLTMIASLFLWLPWFVYARINTLADESWFPQISGPFILEHKERVSAIFSYFALLLKDVEFYAIWPFLLLAFSVTVFLIILRRKILPELFLFCAGVGIFVSYGALYFFSPHDIAWHLETSADRLLFQIFPLFFFAMMAVFASLNKEGEV